MNEQASTVEILGALIGCPSISSRSNLDIVSYIESYLSEHQIASRRIPNKTGDKASVLATIGPPDRAGIVLSAHTDVVPVEGQAWSTPPFTATVREGRVVGRGASDMKGFLACALAGVELFKQTASETPVHLAFSYDEELGCLGVPDLVAAVAALPAKPLLCIVGEPTGLRAVRGHKGKVAKRIVVTGRGGHSALPHRAANAVIAASRITAMLGDLAEEVARTGPRDAVFDPPYTTIHVGSLHGGTALNLVPEHATLEFEIRDIPHEDVGGLLARIDARVADLRRELQRNAPEADIVVEPMFAYPALTIAHDHPGVATVGRLADSIIPAGTVSFGTEAGLYAAAGIPTVVCGPGDISRAHKADEWIGLDELEGANRMMKRLAEKLGQPAEDWITE
jgi:acetylornithine deacetylase